MGIDSTRLGWMGVLRWKAWIRLGCPECERGVSVAHGHRHLAARNWNETGAKISSSTSYYRGFFTFPSFVDVIPRISKP